MDSGASPVPARAIAAALAAATIGALTCAPAPVHAQQDAEPPRAAVEFYQQGREHYREGRYREAIDDLDRALMLDPGSPTLLYNLAKVHELLGDIDEAIEHYEGYLRVLPEGEQEERERIEETLRRLRGAREEVGAGEQLESPEAAPPPEPDESLGGARYVTTRGVADLPFWITAAAGGVLLATGAVLGGTALAKDNEAEGFVLGRDGTADDRDDLQSKADTLALTADVFLVAGGAAVVAAGLLYVLRAETEEVLPSGAVAGVGTDGHGAVVTVGGEL